MSKNDSGTKESTDDQPTATVETLYWEPIEIQEAAVSLEVEHFGGRIDGFEDGTLRVTVHRGNVSLLFDAGEAHERHSGGSIDIPADRATELGQDLLEAARELRDRNQE